MREKSERLGGDPLLSHLDIGNSVLAIGYSSPQPALLMRRERLLPSDPFQRQDIAAHHPDLVARLQRQLDAWNGTLPGYATLFGAKLDEGQRHTANRQAVRP